jgi:hypothetical protein
VDVTYQMARKYSVKAGSRCCPIQIWCNVLDLAVINSWILYKQVIGKNIPRRNFLMQLASELSRLYAKRRRIPAIPATPVANETLDDASSKKRRQCLLEKECKGNKTADICFKCQRPLCGKCSVESQVKCIDCRV